MKWSFIIPALNEQKYLPDTLRCIREACAGRDYEVIVVDHGSSDQTVNIAVAEGAAVIQPSNVETIGALRNRGFAAAHGDILVFLDSDVTVTSQWASHAGEVETLLSGSVWHITGSKCLPPQNGSLLNSIWFSKLAKEADPSHIGTPHLIVHRELFKAVEGFDEALRTGEDYDFCVRAVALGAELTPNPNLVAVHNRLPANLKELIVRERWHGKSDFTSLQAFLGSKVALMTGAFLALHVGIFIALALGNVSAAVALMGGLLVHLMVSSLAKFGRLKLVEMLKTAFVFYFYYLGRSLSILPERSARWMVKAN